MNDFTWIDETPADEFEVGERMTFFDHRMWVKGTYLRQEGEMIHIIITDVMFGYDNMMGTEVVFHRDDQTEMTLSTHTLSTHTLTYDTKDYDYIEYYEEELTEEEEEIEVPNTIGEVITIGKRTHTTDENTNRPRDGPTDIR